jgi:hypothetical protein
VEFREWLSKVKELQQEQDRDAGRLLKLAFWQG